MSTYLQLDAYQWAKFKYRQTFTHLFDNFIGAPWRRDGTLTCRPHPSMEDSLLASSMGRNHRALRAHLSYTLRHQHHNPTTRRPTS